jgi:anaerobic ribonucleoside-triphosphate reductase activating protein
MNYIKFTYPDIANGTGIRLTCWAAGCNHRCHGCHNPQTWDANAGRQFSNESLQELLELLEPDYISGLTLSGGDPLFPANRRTVYEICKAVFERYGTYKDIWMWTGYLWEDIVTDELILKILNYVDVLVDGLYIEAQRNIALPFAGSENQRVIDVRKSLFGKLTLWKEN